MQSAWKKMPLEVVYQSEGNALSCFGVSVELDLGSRRAAPLTLALCPIDLVVCTS